MLCVFRAFSPLQIFHRCSTSNLSTLNSHPREAYSKIICIIPQKNKKKIHFQRSPWRSITHRPGARGGKRGINRRTGRVRVQRGARFDHTPDSGNWVFAAGSHFPSNGRNSWDFQPVRKTPIAKERQRLRATVKRDRKNLAFSNSDWLIDTGISRELEPSHRRLPSAPLTFQPDCIVPCTQRSSSRIFPSRLVKHRRVNNSL